MGFSYITKDSSHLHPKSCHGNEVGHISNLIKEIPLNPAHQDLSKNTKGTFQFLQNFQMQFNVIFNEEIIQSSRTFALRVQMPWNEAHAPLLIESFLKT